jgi:hypothetical protein
LKKAIGTQIHLVFSLRHYIVSIDKNSLKSEEGSTWRGSPINQNNPSRSITKLDGEYFGREEVRIFHEKKFYIFLKKNRGNHYACVN